MMAPPGCRRGFFLDEGGWVNAQVAWPAIIEFAGGQGYAWVADNASLAAYGPHEGDGLIDSRGRVHVLSQWPSGGLYWCPQPGLVCLAQLNEGLRHFAAGLGICCLPKLNVRSAPEAVALVAWLERQ